MISRFVRKIFGSRNDRVIKQLLKTVAEINGLEPELKSLSDQQLQQRTNELRERYQQGETIDELMKDAFALVREAGIRSLGMRHFDVQLLGGIVLNQGKIPEMHTGEGKTLAATLPVYLNALAAKGSHVVTVNDYLARRDGEWMGRLYHFLGMSVGIIQSTGGAEDGVTSLLYEPSYDASEGGYVNLRPVSRKEVYDCDITYGTNNEFGFDYLRDNMAYMADQRVQREKFFAVVDEVDSILIDEARTPLVISGPAEDSSETYRIINKIIPLLVQQSPIEDEDGKPSFGEGDFSVDEKTKQVQLSEEGHLKVEEFLLQNGLLQEGDSLYDSGNIILIHHVNAALRAHVLFQKNVEYMLKNGEVIIIDEYTGRALPGRRWGDGLHQAIEAKEGLTIQNENQTMASITFQNYFRLYEKLSGMTGTADTEAFEFQQIYGLEVVVVPTNQIVKRDDMGDLIYMTSKEKYQAIIHDIEDCVKRGQPVLVGTASIEVSELISQQLQQKNIEHNVLNAKQHEREASIIAEAGVPGVVTIATNMAGRGTDIVLGGNPEVEISALGVDPDETKVNAIREVCEKQQKQVLESGGLHVIGTERHESRRIDNQLRGRSGRQGDAGSTRFYLSLEDPLMRIFASEKVSGLMQKLGMEDGEAIEHPWVSRAIANAQKKVEGRNFDARKDLLEYDDVANDQRKVVYQQRDQLMDSDDISESISVMRQEALETHIGGYIASNSIEDQWDIAGLEESLVDKFGLKCDVQQWLNNDDDLDGEGIRDRIEQEAGQVMKDKEALVGGEYMRLYEKGVMLQVLDQFWKEHLASMDYLRKGIHLRSFAQKNPKQEYKREAFEMFSYMLVDIKTEVISLLLKMDLQPKEMMDVSHTEQPSEDFQFMHEEFDSLSEAEVEDQLGLAEKEPETPFVRSGRKVGRNEPCPCGSGKKYKQCHGKVS